MLLKDYLSMHWGFLILFAATLLLLRLDVHLERKMILRIAFTDTLLLLYSFSTHIENYLGNQPAYTILRPILSALDYSLIVFVLLQITLVLFPMQKRWLYIPALLNAVLCFLSIPTKIVFEIDKNNHFLRHELGYLPYFIAGLYIIYLFFCLFRHWKWEPETSLLLIFMAISAVICFFTPLIQIHDSTEWMTNTLAIDLLLYYNLLLQQFTKSDSLTKLLNRQSYYADLEKHAENITAIVAIDMNGLKEINDREGHVAGDTALAALAACFRTAAKKKQRVYRIGGDEYLLLCLNSDENEVIALTERIQSEVAKTPYSCSVGYAMKTPDISADDAYRTADARMYEEKKRYYAETGKQRQKIR